MAIPAHESPAPFERPLAIYEPSRVIGRSRYLTVLSSPDSVRDVCDFYAAELKRGDWVTTSRVVSGASATLVARRGPHGTTISINDTGTGTAVSIGTC
ncbi:MAG TPA: hypothetical protein VME22_10975 [Solirubrobacteraceae bacterium]|nr:hypothetical protein [Solirubrobacteraceae bacterium]